MYNIPEFGLQVSILNKTLIVFTNWTIFHRCTATTSMVGHLLNYSPRACSGPWTKAGPYLPPGTITQEAVGRTWDNTRTVRTATWPISKATATPCTTTQAVHSAVPSTCNVNKGNARRCSPVSALLSRLDLEIVQKSQKWLVYKY